MCKYWEQLFVLIADVRGVPIVLALGFLPDKKEVLILLKQLICIQFDFPKISYYLFNLLILRAFADRRDEIAAITGRRYLKLRYIMCDFEVSIHKGMHFHFHFLHFWF